MRSQKLQFGLCLTDLYLCIIWHQKLACFFIIRKLQGFSSSFRYQGLQLKDSSPFFLPQVQGLGLQLKDSLLAFTSFSGTRLGLQLKDSFPFLIPQVQGLGLQLKDSFTFLLPLEPGLGLQIKDSFPFLLPWVPGLGLQLKD